MEINQGVQAKATPGGADTDIQYNDNGIFGGSSAFTFNKVDTANVSAVNPQYRLTETNNSKTTLLERDDISNAFELRSEVASRGTVGNALKTYGTDDYVTLPTGVAFADDSSWSISFWMQPNNFFTHGRVLDNYVGGGAGVLQGFYMNTTAAAGTIRFGLVPSDQTTEQTFNTTHVLETLAWYHITLINDEVNDEMVIHIFADDHTKGVFVDVKETFTKTSTGYKSHNQATIGGFNVDSGTFLVQDYDGYVDEMVFWTKALTDDEVNDEQNFGAGRYGQSTDDSLLAGYHCDETSGTNLADYSTNSFDGTLTNDGSGIDPTFIEGWVYVPGATAEIEAIRVQDAIDDNNSLTVIGDEDGTAMLRGALTQVKGDLNFLKHDTTVYIGPTGDADGRVGGSVRYSAYSLAGSSVTAGPYLHLHGNGVQTTANERGLVELASGVPNPPNLGDDGKLQIWSSSADIELQTGTGRTDRMIIGNGGEIGINSPATADHTLLITALAADHRALTLDAAATQTADIMPWRDSVGTVLGGIQSDGNVYVPDEAYGVGWDASLEVPTKNALYDKIETITSGYITSVGDVASGAAFDGTQGTILTFFDAGGNETLDYNGITFNTSTGLDVGGNLAAADGTVLASSGVTVLITTASTATGGTFIAQGSGLNIGLSGDSSGAGTTNYGGYFTASGGSANNYGLFASGTTNAITTNGSVFVNGVSDQVQLTAQAHSTQTNDVIVAEDSSGSTLFAVNGSGHIGVKGTATNSTRAIGLVDLTQDASINGFYTELTASGDSRVIYSVNNILSSGTSNSNTIIGTNGTITGFTGTSNTLIANQYILSTNVATNTMYGDIIVFSLTATDPTSNQIGYYFQNTSSGSDANNKKWAFYNAGLSNNSSKVLLGIDDVKTHWGTGFDATISYDGTDLVIDAAAVGSGVLASVTDVTVPDEAYGVGWNASLEVPTKNAIYDKIEALSGDISSVGDVTSGAAFDGTQGTTLTFFNAGGNATLDYDGTDFDFSKAVNITGTLNATTITDGTASLTGGSLTNVKLGSLTTSGFVTTGSGDGTLSVVAFPLAATFGGTGQSSYTTGDLLIANSINSLTSLADVATGNALISGGVGVVPSWGKINLTDHVTGALFVDGSADEVQATFQGHSTQTSPIVTVEQSDGTDLLTVGNDAQVVITGTAATSTFLKLDGDTVDYAGTTSFIGVDMDFVSNPPASTSLTAVTGFNISIIDQHETTGGFGGVTNYGFKSLLRSEGFSTGGIFADRNSYGCHSTLVIPVTSVNTITLTPQNYGAYVDIQDSMKFDTAANITVSSYGHAIRMLNGQINSGAGTMTTNNYGMHMNLVGSFSGDTVNIYGLYLDRISNGDNAYGIYMNETDTGVKHLLAKDNQKTFFGTGEDASIYYDGTDLIINTDDVGSGAADINGMQVRADGTMKPVQLADASAANDSIYYSTDASKLVYKDSGGTVNNLY